MISFSNYISFWEIVRVLINKRAGLADKRHRDHQLNLLSPDIPIKSASMGERYLLSLMPPRRRWKKIKKEYRYKKCQDGVHHQKKNSMDINKQSIRLTILSDLNNQDASFHYLDLLQEFVQSVQNRIQDCNFALKPPIVFPTKKDDKSCRPLCTFEDLQDSVILIIANRYLTKCLDKFFYRESLAFRSYRLYHGSTCVTTHHDAIARIKEFLFAHNSQPIFVSECDLKKFYDTVSHDVVRSCYYNLMNKLSSSNPECSFDTINRVFEAYLNCYCFPKNVYILNNNDQFWTDNRIVESRRRFEWVEDEIKKRNPHLKNEELSQMKIGVPQGGALSGLIANIVLNEVDSTIENYLSEDALYIRYCDDMIILSSNRETCSQLFQLYYRGAVQLNLFPHEPETDLQFGTSIFWSRKSKNTYLWEMARSDAAEWIGFVGYEIRRDGWIRIRKKSFHKELNKQKEIVIGKVINKLNNKTRVSDNSIISTIKHKLVSMSVGKLSIWNYDYIDGEICWCNGFRELKTNPVLNRQLHTLDRHRNQMIRLAKKHLTKMQKNKEIERKDRKQLQGSSVRHLGRPFSYYYQFTK